MKKRNRYMLAIPNDIEEYIEKMSIPFEKKSHKLLYLIRLGLEKDCLTNKKKNQKDKIQ